MRKKIFFQDIYFENDISKLCPLGKKTCPVVKWQDNNQINKQANLDMKPVQATSGGYRGGKNDADTLLSPVSNLTTSDILNQTVD